MAKKPEIEVLPIFGPSELVLRFWIFDPFHPPVRTNSRMRCGGCLYLGGNETSRLYNERKNCTIGLRCSLFMHFPMI